MDLNRTFAKLLRDHREELGISQERLAENAGLDRTFISQLERGLKSPTLSTVERLAICLAVPPVRLIEAPKPLLQSSPQVSVAYVIRKQIEISIARKSNRIGLPARVLTSAVDLAHGLIDQIYSINLDIAAILGMRNLSAFIGELFATAVLRTCGPLFEANPHQDGYPDLLLMDRVGKAEWDRLQNRRNDKSPFSPFSGGGIEVKATCGSVPTPAACRHRGISRPDLGATRIQCLNGFDWKAHHRETNNLAGLLWDFIDGRPRIVALFYSSDLTENDWGKIVQPKTGGGRTTSVSIMSKVGIQKMCAGWLCVLNDDKYLSFLREKFGLIVTPDEG